MQIKRAGGWKRCIRANYDGGNMERVDGKGGIMMCKLKERMNTGEHYDVEMKGWMEKEAL